MLNDTLMMLMPCDGVTAFCVIYISGKTGIYELRDCREFMKFETEE